MARMTFLRFRSACLNNIAKQPRRHGKAREVGVAAFAERAELGDDAVDAHAVSRIPGLNRVFFLRILGESRNDDAAS